MSPSARARRRLGQHFLVDQEAARRIVAAAAIAPGEAVLEIGPGRGALTGLLIEAAGRIAAVELDASLARRLEQRFRPRELLLLQRDVLTVDLGEVPAALGHPPGTPLVVVGNLPYSISKPIVMELVAARARIARAVLAFQREVADRLTAAPRTRAYGPLGVLAGRAFVIERIAELTPAAFRPRPEVFTTVTRFTPRPAGDLPGEIEPALRSCLQACFARRRKTLLSNLRAALPGGKEQARSLLERAGLDPALRAEAVAPEGFLRLARLWPLGTRLPSVRRETRLI